MENFPEIIDFTLSEELALNDSSLVMGFSTSNGTIDSALYTGKGTTNTISLYALENNSWFAGVTTVSYNPAAGNEAA